MVSSTDRPLTRSGRKRTANAVPRSGKRFGSLLADRIVDICCLIIEKEGSHQTQVERTWRRLNLDGGSPPSSRCPQKTPPRYDPQEPWGPWDVAAWFFVCQEGGTALQNRSLCMDFSYHIGWKISDLSDLDLRRLGYRSLAFYDRGSGN